MPIGISPPKYFDYKHSQDSIFENICLKVNICLKAIGIYMPICPPLAPLPASRPEGTSSWSSRGASPSQTSLWCTRSPCISFTGRHRRREQQPHTVTTESGPPAHGRSRTVTSSSPSLWSHTGA
jgi:hypothetical protein